MVVWLKDAGRTQSLWMADGGWRELRIYMDNGFIVNAYNTSEGLHPYSRRTFALSTLFLSLNS